MPFGSHKGRLMKRLTSLLQSLSGSMEMPHDVILDVPRATIIGRVQVQIENHKGVLEFTPTRVCIGARDGVFVITGSRLRIGSIFKDEVVIDGRIDSMNLQGSESSTGDSPHPIEEKGRRA